MVDAQDETIRFLASPQSYGVDQVTAVHTHGAIVFLAGERAYKLKRAVHYPYMDYSTIERRRAMCLRELEVNRQLAPKLYLEIQDIVRGKDGQLHFSPPASGQLIDSVVVMVRFDQTALLSQLCARHSVDGTLMSAIAGEIAAFHKEAERAPAVDFAEVTRAVVEENIRLLHAALSFDETAVNEFATALRHCFQRALPRLSKRSHSGKIRRCHGDLHLNNIVVISNKPVLFDAIEFNDDYVFIDPIYDVSFLIMDLERIGQRQLAHVLFNRYFELLPDDDGLALLPLYLSLRAAIRAHVAVSRSTGGDRAALNEAHRCFALARDFLVAHPPQLIAIGGFSGSGKTTLARALAPSIGTAPGALILRSDVIRKGLMGVDEMSRLPQSAYGDVMNARVFATLHERARTLLAGGHSVVIDSVYGRPEERARIEAVAQAAGASFYGFWLEAPRHTLSQRIGARRNDASDATSAVLDLQMRTLTPPSNWYRLDADRPPEAVAVLAAKHFSTHRG
jgi:aminoglycoside phosphotransferase family enzyme/cytidylate kinase